MTNDELRALADDLDEATFKLLAAKRTDEAGSCDRAADYLRAQADAQPVAWRTFDGEGNYDYRDYELNEDYADEWNRRNPNHVGWVEALYTHPAPAAPQAEPKPTPASGDDLNVYKEMADNYRNDAQAEPKRGLTCLWSRADDDTDVWETSCGHAFTIIEGTPSDNHMEFCCYCGRRVDEEIGGSDAE